MKTCRRDELGNEAGYFKRSMVLRKDGISKHDCGNVQAKCKQWAISGSFAMLRPTETVRSRSIVVTLRTAGQLTNTVRKEVVTWTQEFIKAKNLESVSLVTDTIGAGGPSVTWEHEHYDAYFQALSSAKIIVTCNPSQWEGDFRLWESILSGALVFVDIVTFWDRMPFPLKHKEHVIVYDRRDKKSFLEMLEYYTSHEDEARMIAKAGKQFVLDHHMASNRIDMLLQEVKDQLR